MLDELERELVQEMTFSPWEAGNKRQVVVMYPPRAGSIQVTCLAAAAALAIAGTSISYVHPVVDLEKLAPANYPTSAAVREEDTRSEIASILQNIRKRSALTWDQLAKIFAVSRRALHHWADGKTVTAENQHKVKSLFQEVLAAGDVEPFIVRSILLKRYNVVGAPQEVSARAEPILVADQAPLEIETPVRRTPATRVRRG